MPAGQPAWEGLKGAPGYGKPDEVSTRRSAASRATVAGRGFLGGLKSSIVVFNRGFLGSLGRGIRQLCYSHLARTSSKS